MDNVTKCHSFYVAKELMYYGTQVHLDLCIYVYNDDVTGRNETLDKYNAFSLKEKNLSNGIPL